MMDDIYYWRKNGGPVPEKNHAHNKYCHYTFQRSKSDSIILQTIHIRDPTSPKRRVVEKGWASFISYSMNKKKRWEPDAVDYLESLQNLDSEVEVLVIGRVNLHFAPYRYFEGFPLFFKYFPISELHMIKDNSYHQITVNSALGQPYKSLVFEENDESEKIALHIIKPIANFEKVKGKNFYSGRGDIKDYRRENYKKRFKTAEDGFFIYKYEEMENLDEKVDLRDYSVNYDDGKYDGPSQFYNLEDHIINKCASKKKRKQSQSESDWSLVDSFDIECL